MDKLKTDVQQKFAEIRNIIYMREKLLLRQADLIFRQLGRVALPTSEIDVKFLAEQEDELLSIARNFGRFQLDNINLQDILNSDELHSDYISPKNDHETMYKSLQQSNGQQENELESNEEKQLHSSHKSLIEHMNTSLNESIIKITLKEARELIKRAKLKRGTPIPPLNLEELDDELESSIAEAVSGLGHDTLFENSSENASNDAKSTRASKKTQSNRVKPKITINNCNGTINLRNISRLTINCATDDSTSVQIPSEIQHRKQCDVNGDVSSPLNTVHNQRKHKQDCKESFCKDKDSSIESSVNEESSISGLSTQGSKYLSSSKSQSQSKSSESRNTQKNYTSKTNNSTTAVFPYDIIEYDDCDNIEQHDISCDFYNRLLNEIQKSLQTKDNTYYVINPKLEQNEKNKAEAKNIETTLNLNLNTSHESPAESTLKTSTTTTTNTSASQTGTGRRLVLKNFENLRIVLEANSSDEETFHPVQIEQWLAEIISTTDLEPMINSEILEHSNINNEEN